jgi:hypothetical protein
VTHFARKTSRIKQKPLAFGRLKKPPSIVDMSYYVTNENSFLDIKNAHLRVTGNVHTDVLKVGSIGFQPSGSNIPGTVNFTNVTTGVTTSSNLDVGGTLNLGTVELSASTHTLDHITARGNVTSTTVQFDNATTGLVTTANVEVGGELTVSGNVTVGTANLFVDTVNNRVGIGTTTPNVLLELSSATGSATITPTELRLSSSTDAGDWDTTTPYARLAFYTGDVTADAPGVMASIGAVASSADGGENTRLAFFTAEPHVERMCVDRYGNVGIGKTNPGATLDVSGDLDISGVSSGWRRQVFKDEYTNNVTKSWKRIAFVNGGSGVLRIHGVIGGHARNTTDEGQAIFDVMFVARSGADIKGYINGRLPSTTGLNIEAWGTTGGGETGDNLTIYLVKEDYSAYNITCEAVHGVTIYDEDWSTTTPSASRVFNLANYAGSFRNNAIGDLHVHGNLSKNSGTFLIEHPLPEKKDTHNLCHSFIEGPKADLIYRGKAILENGIKTINIDTVSNMTEGTFAVLNGDVQCFTTNESDWDNVKGSVDGNILTIESQNTFSTSTVSWMVIGERRDPYMLNAPITDGDGHLITEPTKFEDITYDSYHEEVTSETTTVRSYLSGESL